MYVAHYRSKLRFLTRLIAYVSAANGWVPPLAERVSPKKIAAGLEPERTNELLQWMAAGAASGVDDAAVMDVMNSGGSGGGGGGARGGDDDRRRAEEERAAREAERERVERAERRAAEQRQRDEAYAPRDNNDDGGGGGVRPPYSAPKPSASEERAMEAARQRSAGGNNERVAAGIMGEGALSDDSDDDVGVDDLENRNAAALANQMGDIGGSGVDGKLVRDIKKAQDAAATAAERDRAGGGGGSGGVQLGRIGAGRDSAARAGQQKQLAELRSQIQTLCQAANPLGKCVEFVYEDLDHMQRELAQWRAEQDRNAERVAEEKAITEEALAPLHTEADAVERETADVRARIAAVKAQIIANDTQIKELLEQHITGSVAGRGGGGGGGYGDAY